MRFLLVDARDGKILAESVSLEEAAIQIGRVLREDPTVAGRVQLVRHHETVDGLATTSTVITARPLLADPPRRTSRPGTRT
jgi:hypothetical protein